jgi:hypothetical protein
MEEHTQIVISIIAGSTGTINMPIHGRSSGNFEGGQATSDVRRTPPVTVRVTGKAHTRVLMELIIKGRRFRLAELNGEGEITISGLMIDQILESGSGETEASLQFHFEHSDPRAE